MPVNRKPIFDAVKILRGGRPFIQSEVTLLDAAIDAAMATPVVTPPAPPLPPAPRHPATTDAPNGFSLGGQSRDELKPVHPKLRQCVELAIKYTLIDFRVQQGLRTLKEQQAAMAAGTTRTMKSKHLIQPDHFAWAVDLVALKDGKISWDFGLYYYIAMAMDRAATELGIANHIRWGCAWDRVLSDFGGDKVAYLNEVAAYKKRHSGSDFLDGPHFEWVA